MSHFEALFIEVTHMGRTPVLEANVIDTGLTISTK